MGWGASAFEAELASLPPAERWAYQYGTSVVPSPAVILGDTTQDATAYAQELAVQATRIRTIADEHRIAALLTAFEQAMEDLGIRFGPTFRNPDGPAGQAFARTFALPVPGAVPRHRHRQPHRRLGPPV